MSSKEKVEISNFAHWPLMTMPTWWLFLPNLTAYFKYLLFFSLKLIFVYTIKIINAKNNEIVKRHYLTNYEDETQQVFVRHQD